MCPHHLPKLLSKARLQEVTGRVHARVDSWVVNQSLRVPFQGKNLRELYKGIAAAVAAICFLSLLVSLFFTMLLVLRFIVKVPWI